MMKPVIRFIKQRPIMLLMLAIPFVLAAELFAWDPIWKLIFTALSIVPMAGLIGEATEGLAEKAGPQIGGLINATLGNAAELIITLIAIRSGLLDLVKASITGSILGNILLVLGFAMVVGGAKNGVQKFDRRQAGNHAVLLIIAVLALLIPSIFSHNIGSDNSPQVETLSLGVAVIMMILYGLGLFFSFTSHEPAVSVPVEPEKHPSNRWPLKKSLIVLAVSTLSVVILSEILVDAVEPVVQTYGISEFFIGIILIPIIGNAAEHIVAVQVAYRNKMELSVEVAISSSLQIALFVAPLLVFVSLAMGHPLTLIFNIFELIALASGVVITTLVSTDGESNWFEGAALISVYLILGTAFFFLH
jgi:Ca2+:H+ antiporter